MAEKKKKKEKRDLHGRRENKKPNKRV